MRILLVEDEPDLGRAIQRSLIRECYVVDWVQAGDAAWDYLDNPQTIYTVAIFDWMLPGLSGLELCQRLRSNHNPLPVLMLTARDRIEDRVIGLDAGADDYLVKPFGMEELKARVRALQRRSPQIQPPKIQVADLILDYATHTLSNPNPYLTEQSIRNQSIRNQSISLTAKEFQILEYFMKRPGQVIASEQLMNQLWETGAEPTSNVVAAQIRLLRRKLAETGYEGLIETVHGMGYRFNVSHASK
ncbi:MAG: two-component system response regulator RppA [Leptolyngbyaceae cyanobacterium bins.302]|nr:two-component system response regulator RppA [Leptolyngbyaceae cyanobacterium bins.302]